MKSINDYIFNANNEFICSKNNIIAFTTRKKINFTSEEVLDQVCLDKKINIANIAQCEQIHSNNVQLIKTPDLYKGTDGLVTSIDNNIVLLIKTADCLPIFLFDEKTGLIGLIHSGWKGTYKKIVLNAIDIFLAHGSIVKDIKAYLGPSIKRCCYEVQNDVSQYFNNNIISHIGEKQYLDLDTKVIHDMVKAGIKKNNIFESTICTFEHTECCSYRKYNKNAGRMYSLLGVKRI